MDVLTNPSGKIVWENDRCDLLYCSLFSTFTVFILALAHGPFFVGNSEIKWFLKNKIKAKEALITLQNSSSLLIMTDLANALFAWCAMKIFF